jgi:cytolysin-activating lysine-acyltransferase
VSNALPPAERSVAESLGLAMQVIFRRGCYLDYPLASIKAWLFPAAQLRQLHVFIGEDQRVLGYMTWAWFSAETEERWKRGAIDVLHIGEWNEGDRLWILDFVAMPGLGKLCFWLAPALFPAGTVAHSLPRRSPLPPSSIIRWTRRAHPQEFPIRWRIR